MIVKYFIFSIAITVSIIIDILFALGRYPVLTILVCAIVVLYEFVSPYLYVSR